MQRTICGVGGSGGHQLGEVGGGARYCGGMVQVLLVTHMGDGVSNNGGDSESSSNAVGRRPVIMVGNL